MNYCNEGYAKKLLKACEELSLQWNKKNIFLHVETKSTPAFSLYVNTGFSPVEFVHGNEVVFMKKSLSFS
jgi:ribosomal protein S18 acetylase RimI-like enzyme